MTPSNVSNEEEKYTIKIRFSMTINQQTLDGQYIKISGNMKSAVSFVLFLFLLFFGVFFFLVFFFGFLVFSWWGVDIVN